MCCMFAHFILRDHPNYETSHEVIFSSAINNCSSIKIDTQFDTHINTS
jgi:hypothetical protein